MGRERKYTTEEIDPVMDSTLNSKISDRVNAVKVQIDPALRIMVPALSLIQFHKSLPTFSALALLVFVDWMTGLMSGRGVTVFGTMGATIFCSLAVIHDRSGLLSLGRMTRRMILRLYLSCRMLRMRLAVLPIVLCSNDGNDLDDELFLTFRIDERRSNDPGD